MDTINTEKNSQNLSELRAQTMKITEALYRTTDLFSDAEPLKWSLRDSAVKILNTISDISSHPSYQELRSAQILERMIESLCYKLDLAVGGTFVARSNFDVLEREYKSLSEKICNIDFFGAALLEKSTEKKNQISIGSDILDISDKRTLAVQKSPIEFSTNTMYVHGSPTSTVAAEVGLPTSVAQIKSPTSVLSDRKGIILNLIKERGPSSVGDMRKLVDMSLSEKTIQRDLNAMAEAGILKREGEKRWRRYFV